MVMKTEQGQRPQQNLQNPGKMQKTLSFLIKSANIDHVNFYYLIKKKRITVITLAVNYINTERKLCPLATN